MNIDVLVTQNRRSIPIVKGDLLPGSGHLQVHVVSDAVTVLYVRAAGEEMEQRGMRNGEAVFTHSIPKW